MTLAASASLRERAADFWFAREQAEVLAATLFFSLAQGMRDADAPDALVSLAERSGRDELDHADRCRAVVSRLSDRERAPVSRQLRRVALGPASLSPEARTLYGAVAMGCVTETLSTALLLNIQRHATDALVAETVHAILRDEVQHSRLGWAYLAHRAEREGCGWLRASLPNMLKAALDDEMRESADLQLASGALAGFGILSGTDAARICQDVITTVIAPGIDRLIPEPALVT